MDVISKCLRIRRAVAAVLIGLSLFLSPAPAAAVQDDSTSIEKFQEDVSSMVIDFADGIDRFFASERYYTYEANRSRLRLILYVDAIEDHGVDVSPRVKFHLILPRLENRLRIVFNDEEEGDVKSAGEDFTEESNISLRWVGRQSRRLNLSFDLGVRFRDDTPAGFVRANSQTKYDLGSHWGGRTSGRLYWYTDTGWRIDLRQYFERTLSEKMFFRSRTRVQWFDEKKGLFPDHRFSLFQRLSPKHVLAYEVIGEIVSDSDSAFEESEILSPDEYYTRLQSRVRFRFNAFRPWLFFELWSGVAFPEERDYEAILLGRFSAEITFGYLSGGMTKLSED